MAGTWMQMVAQGWLVLQLTGSGTSIGLVTACQYVPVLLLGPLGGIVVDRLPTRPLLVVTQFLQAVLALILGVLTITGVVQLWMVFALAAALGAVTVVDNPARQTFVLELVGRDLLSNAVTLNSVNVNVARIVGPSAAAITIALVGVGTCFILNGVSFFAVIAAFLVMRSADFQPRVITPRAKGQLRAGFRYVWATPAVRTPLLMMALIGTLAYEFPVILPIMAKYTFGGSAGTYGIMTSAMGSGAVIGGLVAASRARSGVAAMVRVSLLFGLSIFGLAISPTLPVALVALVLIGAGSITFAAIANTTLQLTTEPAMRGRVMSLWTVAFLGTTPIGGPIVGYIGEHADPRWAVATGAASCLAAAVLGAWRPLTEMSKSRVGRPAAGVATAAWARGTAPTRAVSAVRGDQR
jgi:MFS family permease